ncbi:hypothetical protein CONPUDRAFT_59184 [Coniophora puteana RWD-64-598 SS2]|uniref:Nicotinamide N-methyltransferase n=1 Tax=Coniophora puteana (strain RWD-64-598) TaxID=741705 RepID=A0A5M3MKS7_CONPW|nr:uncharacterized protein CONPUDRAFT_59184 [Coniophora puteana RWD-64-598 SS2]EIW79424.1 hypothetical protein CONPUDRAFT_59184 [Coniophora puteana RWD-64-598 SS2]
MSSAILTENRRSREVSKEIDDPEDILSSSLQTLYDYAPITYSAPGSLFTYPPKHQSSSHTPVDSINLRTPETHSANWSLHASAIWVASLFIADNIHRLGLDEKTSNSDSPIRVLELGAGAGLPSILISKFYQNVSVVVSDYPDESLIRTLHQNVEENKASGRCTAAAYAWGMDTSTLTSAGASGGPFDVVIAADTLWNPDLHTPFIDTLARCLRKDDGARIHLVAGLHTGRYTIQAFLNAVITKDIGLALESATEHEVSGQGQRTWDVDRAEGEDERERRKWVVWMILRWH